MDGVDADQIEAQFAQWSGLQAFGEDLLGELRASDRSGSGVRDLTFAGPAVVKTYRDLQRVGPGLARGSCDANAVVSEILELNVGEIGDYVGGYI